MSHDPLVEVLGISHTYPSSKRGQEGYQALKEVSFSVQAGEIFGLLGPNGGGKTTLFKILSTVLRPTKGTAKLFGKDIQIEPHEVRHNLGVAFQSPSLDKKLTAEENLRHHGHLYGMRGLELKTRIGEMLSRVGLEGRGRAIVETLSGGTRRRVELAKTLLHRPRLLIMDEPSTGLDPGARKDFRDYLEQLRVKDGITILLTTHLLEEAVGCDRLAILDQGQVVAMGTPNQLTSEIGGDMITIHTPNPKALLLEIQERFGTTPSLLNGAIRVERQDGHKFIPQLVEAFPGKIDAVTLGKPTLEDVFIRRTGHALWNDE
jgi:ABC-2 type transport system ATP-binding protein